MSWLPDWITGYDRTAYEEGLQADAKNRALTEDLRNRGLITEQDYRAAQQHYDASAAYNPDAEITDAFDEGLNDGAANIRNTIGGAINLGIGTPLKLIPWQVWVALAIYVAWRLGAFNGILAKGK